GTRRRRPAVPDVTPLGADVPGGGALPEHLAVAGPDAQDVALGAALAGGGEEDAVAPDDRGGVAGAGQLRLPEEVRRLAPGKGGFRVVAVTLPAGAAPLRPVGGVFPGGGVGQGQPSGEEDECGQGEQAAGHGAAP